MGNDNAETSPVIGVILMVAIVVILAAVITAFVNGFVGNKITFDNKTTVAITVSDRIDVQPWGALPYCTILTTMNETYSARGTADCVKLQKGYTVIATIDGDVLSNIQVMP